MLFGMGTLEHNSISDELAETLTLHAMDLLDADAATNLERHLAEGCHVCEQHLKELRDTVAAVSATAPSLVPPAHLRDRVMAAVHTAPCASPVSASGDGAWPALRLAYPPDLLIVRSNDEDWQQVAAGVWAKRLYVDEKRDTVTMLVRMDAGATYGPHRHAGPEQCYVLEGDLRAGELVVSSGDFQCAAEGTVHGTQRTESGCLLLVVSSLRDELLN